MIELTLKEYMEDKGISATYIHEKTGIRYATLMDMIHGHRKSVKLEYLGKVMQALHISDINLIMKKHRKVYL